MNGIFTPTFMWIIISIFGSKYKEISAKSGDYRSRIERWRLALQPVEKLARSECRQGDCSKEEGEAGPAPENGFDHGRVALVAIVGDQTENTVGMWFASGEPARDAPAANGVHHVACLFEVFYEFDDVACVDAIAPGNSLAMALHDDLWVIALGSGHGIVNCTRVSDDSFNLLVLHVDLPEHLADAGDHSHDLADWAQAFDLR
jgi:hypothetical protein